MTDCAYSAITRVELLGFPGISEQEDRSLRDALGRLIYLPISPPVEDLAIQLRRTRKIKLPDALIAATAIHHGLELLTLDQHLQSVTTAASGLSTREHE